MLRRYFQFFASIGICGPFLTSGCNSALHLPFIRLYKPSSQEIVDAMVHFNSADFNYMHTGFLCTRDNRLPAVCSLPHGKKEGMILSPSVSGLPPGYSVKCISVCIGEGMREFKAATDLMFDFTPTNSLEWVQFVSGETIVASGEGNIVDGKIPTLRVGSTVATLSRFYNSCLWSLNPCRVVSVVRNHLYKLTSTSVAPLSGTRTASEVKNCDNSQGVDSSGRIGVFSEIVYSTLKGHLIAGEEAFRVRMETITLDTGETKRPVFFEVLSYSRGCGLLGRIAMPLVRPLQRKFLIQHGRMMTKLMSERKSDKI